MKELTFKFKQFSARHSGSSMRIGVDAVLIGAWAQIEKAKSILDVGTGCGVIALMCAQRNPDAKIIGIDTDKGSIEEAEYNFRHSPWSDRLTATQLDFTMLSLQDLLSCYGKDSVDFIISNPPYFNAGMQQIDTSRKIARHQAALSPHSLLSQGSRLLSPEGKIAMIVPVSEREACEETASANGLFLQRHADVCGRRGKGPKRVMLEYGLADYGAPISQLINIEEETGGYTQEYQNLTDDFYIIF